MFISAGGQVSGLPSLRGARPGPVFGLLDQAGPHWIPFDVLNNSFKFLAVAHPMIVGLVLPESPCSIENKIGLVGARVLHGPWYLTQRFVRLQQRMYMVRHDDPSEELVQLPFLLANSQGFDDFRRHSRMFEECRSGASRVQLPVEDKEPLAFRSGAGLRPASPRAAWKRPVQTPGQEYRDALGLPMRQSTAIEAHAIGVSLTLQDSQAAGRRPAPQKAQAERKGKGAGREQAQGQGQGKGQAEVLWRS
jgi:hypothetical protein